LGQRREDGAGCGSGLILSFFFFFFSFYFSSLSTLFPQWLVDLWVRGSCEGLSRQPSLSLPGFCLTGFPRRGYNPQPVSQRPGGQGARRRAPLLLVLLGCRWCSFWFHKGPFGPFTCLLSEENSCSYTYHSIHVLCCPDIGPGPTWRNNRR